MPDLAGSLSDAARALLSFVIAHQHLALFAALLIEEAGVPLPAPGDVIVVYFASRHREEPAALVAAFWLAVLASALGAQGPFALARRFGPRFLGAAGRFLHVDPAQVARARDALRRHGRVAVAVLRVIPGLRLPIALLAGAARVRARDYVPAVVAAAIVYWSVWIAVGLLFGEAIDMLIAHVPLRLALPLLLAGACVIAIVRALAPRRRAR